MGARWEDVVDAQIDLVTGLTSGVVRRHLEGFLEIEEGKGRVGYGDARMPDRLAAMAFNADPIYVEPDMMTVWEATIPSFQSEPLVAEDLVTPAGFLVLPRPFMSQDVHGKMTSLRAILWHPHEFIVRIRDKDDPKVGPPDVRDGDILVGSLPDRPRAPVAGGGMPQRWHGLPDGYSPRVTAPVEKLADDEYRMTGVLISLWHHSRDDDDYSGDYDDIEHRLLPPCLIISHLLPWTYGARWDAVDDPRSVIRPLQALWRLMQQTVAVRDHQRPSSPFRKRWDRAGLPEKNVTIVRLRRPSHQTTEQPDEHRAVDWQSRWIVRGHWRQQWYSSLGMHRQIWISPFVKGPEEKPLRVRKATVFELVR